MTRQKSLASQDCGKEQRRIHGSKSSNFNNDQQPHTPSRLQGQLQVRSLDDPFPMWPAPHNLMPFPGKLTGSSFPGGHSHPWGFSWEVCCRTPGHGGHSGVCCQSANGKTRKHITTWRPFSLYALKEKLNIHRKSVSN